MVVFFFKYRILLLWRSSVFDFKVCVKLKRGMHVRVFNQHRRN
jgi:hypothetical protein